LPGGYESSKVAGGPVRPGGRNLQYSRGMTLSARNQLEGTVEEIQLGGVMAHVGVRVGRNLIESVITRRSAEERVHKRGRGDTGTSWDRGNRQCCFAGQMFYD